MYVFAKSLANIRLLLGHAYHIILEEVGLRLSFKILIEEICVFYLFIYFRGFILPLYFPNGGKLNHNNYKKVTLQNIFYNKKNDCSVNNCKESICFICRNSDCPFSCSLTQCVKHLSSLYQR